MLNINEGGNATAALGLGDDVLGNGGLTRRFWPVDLADAALWKATNAEGDVK